MQEPTDLQLSPIQQHFLEYVYKQFRDLGRWPPVWRVDMDLEDALESEGGLASVCCSLGQGMVVCAPPYQNDGQVKLRVRALQLIPEAGNDIAAFLALCRYSSDLYRHSPEQPAQLSLRGFIDTTGVEERTAQRAFTIALLDGHFYLGGSAESFTLNNFAPKLASVATLDEYDRRWTLFQERSREQSPVSLGSIGSVATSNGTRIFISHASSDAPVAAYIARFIKAANRQIEVFVSSVPGQIQTGEDWLETIRVELRRADAFLVLLSARSVLRPWIWFETGAAWHSKRPLYPLVLPGLTKSEVPMPLSAHQMLSLDLERDVEQLLADLDLVVPDIAKVVANIRSLSDGLISSQTEISEPDKSVGAT